MNTQIMFLKSRAKFLRYEKGMAYYSVPVPYSDNLYSFPVPVNSTTDGLLVAEKNTLYFMEYIDRAIQNGTLKKEAA